MKGTFSSVEARCPLSAFNHVGLSAIIRLESEDTSAGPGTSGSRKGENMSCPNTIRFLSALVTTAAMGSTLAGLPVFAEEPYFTGLGDLPGSAFRSRANGVSGDGGVVVGYSAGTAGTEGFRWTAAGGMVGLGDIPGGIFGSQANAASADGSVIVGFGFYDYVGQEASRCTATGWMVGLGILHDGS